MTLDIQTAKANLAKAQEDVQFWENALRLLNDPRITAIEGTWQHAAGTKGIGVLFSSPSAPTPRPYGELKRRTLEALPGWGQPPVSTSKLVAVMERGGYQFASKTPSISVNEALVSLEVEGLAFMAVKQGITRFWTKSQPKQTEERND